MMTSHELTIMRRTRRRTHIILTGTAPMCGTRTAVDQAHTVQIPINGGATARLKNDLIREMDGNACIPCTRIALGMIALYAARDTGKAW